MTDRSGGSHTGDADPTTADVAGEAGHPVQLQRTLNLPLMILYGLGTTVGAGIYALIGEIASTAGYLAPLSFLVACALAGFTALSFSELSAHFPRAGAAALYVERGFASSRAALLIGLMVTATGVVSSAALINGFTGYLLLFVTASPAWISTFTVVLLALLAVWGVSQSVSIAAVVSVIEVAALIWITVVCFTAADMSSTLQAATSTVSGSSFVGVFAGSILAFYAFIGFEDMVEMAEEVKNPRRTMPIAIIATLLLSSLIYVLLMTAAVAVMPPAQLAVSDAPLADLYKHATGGNPAVIGVVALFAIVNGALIQMLMASRVLYGLASRQQLPAILGRVHPRTHTPLIATTLIGVLTLTLALVGNLALLAEATSLLMLIIFAAVNLALWKLKRRNPAHYKGIPRWLALVGAVVCGGFVVLRATTLIFGQAS